MSVWDERYLDMCLLVAKWSKDPSTKVGAVIADKSNRLVSSGFNGFASGFADTLARWSDREFKYKHVLHAEENAILQARQDLTGCTMYVQIPPCSLCMTRIAQSGIKRVVCYKPSKDYLERWGIDAPLQVAEECGIVVEMLNK